MSKQIRYKNSHISNFVKSINQHYLQFLKMIHLLKEILLNTMGYRIMPL
jgi:hypothetical protein